MYVLHSLITFVAPLRWILGLILLVGVTPHHASAKRVALVVGVSEYRFSPPLANPKNDAADLANALRKAGFEVLTSIDQGMAEFVQTLDGFYERADGADAAVFFFAGHGLQLDGVNYLVPRDAQLRSEAAVKLETVALQDVISAIENRAQVSLIFLDACRDNPLAEQLQRSLTGRNRSAAVQRGLASMVTRNPDTLLVFAAAPGRTASDGDGRNSPFTSALLKNMAEPGVEIETMLKRVTRDVRHATNGEQSPERLSRLVSDFIFVAKPEDKDWNAILKDFGPPPEIPIPPTSAAKDGCGGTHQPIKCLWDKSR